MHGNVDNLVTGPFGAPLKRQASAKEDGNSPSPRSSSRPSSPMKYGPPRAY